MAQDLRKLFEAKREQERFEMKDGHEERFMDLLEETLPEGKPVKKQSFFWLRVAASVVLAVGIGGYFLHNTLNKKEDIPVQTTVVERTETPEFKVSLGDLSPELKQVENYYVANINLQLAALEVSENNKALADGYMEQLEKLDTEYRNLTEELNELGPNDQTISALIKNLQLRLQLLQKLEVKLNQLKSSKNEQQSTNTI